MKWVLGLDLGETLMRMTSVVCDVSEVVSFRASQGSEASHDSPPSSRSIARPSASDLHGAAT